MDTPTTPKSGSYLVIVVGFVAVIAVILGGIALKRSADLNKKLADINALAARVDSVESSAKRTGDEAKGAVANLRATYDRYFDQINQEFASLRTQMNKVAMDTKDMVDKLATSPAPRASSTGSGGATPSGPAPGTLSEDGTYVIKGGDTLGRIATQFGVSLAELQAANPGVDSRKLRVGQRINVPAKE